MRCSRHCLMEEFVAAGTSVAILDFRVHRLERRVDRIQVFIRAPLRRKCGKADFQGAACFDNVRQPALVFPQSLNHCRDAGTPS